MRTFKYRVKQLFVAFFGTDEQKALLIGVIGDDVQEIGQSRRWENFLHRYLSR